MTAQWPDRSLVTPLCACHTVRSRGGCAEGGYMSVSDAHVVGPSAWAVERFGQHAGAVAAAVPEQLAKAHAKAHAAHLAAGLKKRSPYGVALAGVVRENLAETARELGECVRDVRGYEHAVINDHALFPFRYAAKQKQISTMPRSE